MKRNIRDKIFNEVGYPIIDHLDHKKEKGKIYSYPYPFSKESCKKLIEFCDNNNLDFYIKSDNTYNPGSTVEIEIFENNETKMDKI